MRIMRMSYLCICKALAGLDLNNIANPRFWHLPLLTAQAILGSHFLSPLHLDKSKSIALRC